MKQIIMITKQSQQSYNHAKRNNATQEPNNANKKNPNNVTRTTNKTIKQTFNIDDCVTGNLAIVFHCYRCCILICSGFWKNRIASLK